MQRCEMYVHAPRRNLCAALLDGAPRARDGLAEVRFTGAQPPFLPPKDVMHVVNLCENIPEKERLRLLE